MIMEKGYAKVLRYSPEQARIYYVNEEQSAANILDFTNENGSWRHSRWDAVWSKTGSAESYVWPYFYHSVEGIVTVVLLGLPVLILITGLLIALQIQEKKRRIDELSYGSDRA